MRKNVFKSVRKVAFMFAMVTLLTTCLNITKVNAAGVKEDNVTEKQAVARAATYINEGGRFNTYIQRSFTVPSGGDYVKFIFSAQSLQGSTSSMTISVTNSRGQEVWGQKYTPGSGAKIHREQLSAGTYTLTFFGYGDFSYALNVYSD